MRKAIENSKVFQVRQRLSVDLGIAQFAADWRRRHGDGNLLMFCNLAEFPEMSVALDIVQRPQLLSSLNLPADNWQPEAVERLSARNGQVSVGVSRATETVKGFQALPALVHQPRDRGRYLTSAVTVINDPESGRANLGCYRIFLLDEFRCTVFMDPRTDGYDLTRRSRLRGKQKVPATIFLGGPLGSLLCAAAALPRDSDDYQVLSQLAAEPLISDDGLSHEFPPAPVDAEIVIRGYIVNDADWEGPFGEFKGYYSTPTRSPVFESVDIRRRPNAIFPGLLCGKKAGLTLMAMQNELLMFSRLQERGFKVDRVDNPLSGFGEYLCVVQSPSPTPELLQAAMSIDLRAKIFVVTTNADDLMRPLSKYPFEVKVEEYIRHGRVEGKRVGFVALADNRYDAVEW